LSIKGFYHKNAFQSRYQSHPHPYLFLLTFTGSSQESQFLKANTSKIKKNERFRKRKNGKKKTIEMSFSITIQLYCYRDSVLYCYAPPSCTWKYVLLENWFHSIASEQFFQFTFKIELKLKIFFSSFFPMLFISISFFRYFAMQFFFLVRSLFKTPSLWAPLRQTAVMESVRTKQHRKKNVFGANFKCISRFFMLVKAQLNLFMHFYVCTHIGMEFE